MTDRPRLLPCGDAALSVDFGNVISVAVNRRVHALAAALGAADLAGVIETVPTYRALTVHFDPLVLPPDLLERTVQGLLDHGDATVQPARRWHVPAVFGGAFGVDLDACANAAGLDPADYIATFVAPVYRVMMIGFMPGFSYLANLPEGFARPRLATPRAAVPKGSISIGGAQAAIGSVEGPSGWHLLGRTPAVPFLPGREPLFLFEPGDEIVFDPVSASDWGALAAAAERGDPLVRLVETEPRP